MHYLVQGDTGSQIRVSLTRDATGLGADLSSCTGYLKFKKRGTSTILFTLEGTIDTVTSSIIFYFESNLDNLVGFYTGEVEIVYDSGTIESVYETINFQVREDF